MSLSCTHVRSIRFRGLDTKGNLRFAKQFAIAHVSVCRVRTHRDDKKIETINKKRFEERLYHVLKEITFLHFQW